MRAIIVAKNSMTIYHAASYLKVPYYSKPPSSLWINSLN